jgi:hypothetical protein
MEVLATICNVPRAIQYLDQSAVQAIIPAASVTRKCVLKMKSNSLRSRIMRAVKGRDTGPEKAVRSTAHGMGYRFRLHRADIPASRI